MCKSKEYISTEKGIYVVTEVKGVSVRTFSVKSKGFIYAKAKGHLYLRT